MEVTKACIVAFMKARNSWHSLKWGPRTRDRRTRNPRSQEPDPRDQRPGTRYTGHGTENQGPKTQDWGLWDSETGDSGALNVFIELQNKMLKSKKSLTSKRDKAKDPFTKLFFTYFSRVKVYFWNFQEDYGYRCILFKDHSSLSRSFAFQSTQSSLRKTWGRHIIFKFV